MREGWNTGPALDSARVEEPNVEHSGGAGIAEGWQAKGEQRLQFVRRALGAELPRRALLACAACVQEGPMLMASLM